MWCDWLYILWNKCNSVCVSVENFRIKIMRYNIYWNKKRRCEQIWYLNVASNNIEIFRNTLHIYLQWLQTRHYKHNLFYMNAIHYTLLSYYWIHIMLHSPLLWLNIAKDVDSSFHFFSDTVLISMSRANDDYHIENLQHDINCFLFVLCMCIYAFQFEWVLYRPRCHCEARGQPQNNHG